MTRQEFLDEAEKLYGDRYDYTNVTEDNITYGVNVPIRCSRHGLFWVSSYQHLHNNVGCFECYKEENWENNKREL